MKLSIITIAYNSQKYIEACAQSVLNQTLRDIQWVVLDNGCTDGTGEMLQSYAERDARVKLLRNKDNFVNVPDGEHVVSWWCELVDYCDGEYYATLDSDDTYDLTFAETMYTLAKAHDADVAACGTAMFRENETVACVVRTPPLLEGAEPARMGDAFPYYYGSFRPVWGKVFKKDVHLAHRAFIEQRPAFVKNGADTLFCLRFLRMAKRVACLNRPLHRYTVRMDSAYYATLDVNRLRSYDHLYHEGIALLEQWDKLNQPNLDFLFIVYYYSMTDCIDVAARAGGAPALQRAEFLKQLIASPILCEHAAQMDIKLKMELVGKWLAVAVNIAGLDDDARFELYMAARTVADAAADNQIYIILQKYPLLSAIDVESAVFLSGAVMEIMRGNLPRALETLLEAFETNEIPAQYVGSHMALGSGVCAMLPDDGGIAALKAKWSNLHPEHP